MANELQRRLAETANKYIAEIAQTNTGIFSEWDAKRKPYEQLQEQINALETTLSQLTGTSSSTHIERLRSELQATKPQTDEPITVMTYEQDGKAYILVPYTQESDLQRDLTWRLFTTVAPLATPDTVKTPYGTSITFDLKAYVKVMRAVEKQPNIEVDETLMGRITLEAERETVTEPEKQERLYTYHEVAEVCGVTPERISQLVRTKWSKRKSENPYDMPPKVVTEKRRVYIPASEVLHKLLRGYYRSAVHSKRDWTKAKDKILAELRQKTNTELEIDYGIPLGEILALRGEAEKTIKQHPIEMLERILQEDYKADIDEMKKDRKSFYEKWRAEHALDKKTARATYGSFVSKNLTSTQTKSTPPARGLSTILEQNYKGDIYAMTADRPTFYEQWREAYKLDKKTARSTYGGFVLRRKMAAKRSKDGVKFTDEQKKKIFAVFDSEFADMLPLLQDRKKGLKRKKQKWAEVTAKASEETGIVLNGRQLQPLYILWFRQQKA